MENLWIIAVVVVVYVGWQLIKSAIAKYLVDRVAPPNPELEGKKVCPKCKELVEEHKIRCKNCNYIF